MEEATGLCKLTIKRPQLMFQPGDSASGHSTALITLQHDGRFLNAHVLITKCTIIVDNLVLKWLF